MNKNVKVKGYYLLDGKRLLNPGSVITLEEDMANEFCKRGLGVPTNAACFEAPPPEADGIPGESAPLPVERQDLSSKLASAERAVSPPQAKARGAI